jgi:hypothetical protein
LRRTLHDSYLCCPGIHIILQPALALADTPVCAILPTRADSLFTSRHNRLSGKIQYDLSFPVIHVQSSPQPPRSPHLAPHAISKPHSKHIVPSGGFAQPILSLVLRREGLRNPSQHLGLSTSDRILVGYHTLEAQRNTTAVGLANRRPPLPQISSNRTILNRLLGGSDERSGNRL